MIVIEVERIGIRPIPRTVWRQSAPASDSTQLGQHCTTLCPVAAMPELREISEVVGSFMVLAVSAGEILKS